MLTLFVCFLLAGCSSGPRRAAPVNATLAREALHTALDCWRKGEPAEVLKRRKPAVTAQDFDWKSGYRLVDFQVLGEGTDDTANLRCPVKLTLRDPHGREVKKKVTYIIGTDPVITVFREMRL
jgi:hypothetical protein